MPTPVTFVPIAEALALMFGIVMATFGSTAEIDARALRRLNCAQIDRRSEVTRVTCALIAAMFAQMIVIDVGTCATCREIGGTRAATNADRQTNQHD